MATLGDAIELALVQVGLSTTNTDYKNRARQYINTTADELAPVVPWWFLDRTTTFKTTRTLTITGASGTFTAGEEIRDAQGSYYSATVDSYDATNGLLKVYSENTVTPTGTLTGQSSSATATYASRAYTRVYMPVSGQITSWHSFWDETNDRRVQSVDSRVFDRLDIDQDEEGDIEAIYPAGMDPDTGYPTLETWRRPSTTNETIRARYRLRLGPWTSSNDSTELSVLGVPPVLESALWLGAGRYYCIEKRNRAAAQDCAVELARVVDLALEQNLQMQGDQSRPPLSDEGRVLLNYGTSIIEA